MGLNKPPAPVRLEGWYVINDKLYGNVYNHPWHENGVHIRCGRFHALGNGVFKANRFLYRLGRPLYPSEG